MVLRLMQTVGWTNMSDYELGYQAYGRGVSSDQNPYDADTNTVAYMEWDDGWNDAAGNDEDDDEDDYEYSDSYDDEDYDDDDDF
jgi:ribosome modulation factor